MAGNRRDYFDNRGDMRLKSVAAILDIITIAVLITGLHLWLRRRKSSVSIATANA